MIKTFLKNIGPGPLIAAAFIGPGTVTLCTLAGVNFGYALLWAMVLSVMATIVLQEMAARLGILTQKGLAQILREEISSPLFRILSITLILSAIVVGNAAYEAGNISGAVLGVEAIAGVNAIEMGSMSINLYSIFIGLAAFVLLYIGKYKVLERSLIILVILMSIAFVITALLTKPSISGVLKGLFVPSTPEGSVLTIVGLIGTTVVPYNLFLHASLVKERWHNQGGLGHARTDTFVAVILGGIVSLCIIIAAAAIKNAEINSAADLALGLEPLFGSFSKYVMAIGLFAAGITSAITAPLAAAFVVQGCLGWKGDMRSLNFRFVWIAILLIGVFSSSSGLKSIEIIKFAQVANGLLLPLIAAYLLWLANRKNLLGKFTNGLTANIFGFLILGISIFLGIKSIVSVFGWI